MQLSFQYEDRNIPFTVVYRNRKTLSIKVQPPGEIIVSAPVGTSKTLIVDKVAQNAPWILGRLGTLNEPAGPPEDDRTQDTVLWYRGQSYFLDVEQGSKNNSGVKLRDEKIVVTVPQVKEQIVRQVLLDWYRRQAQSVIIERVHIYQDHMHVKWQQIRVKDQKRRWGSCSSLGNLNFNWRLIMAPPDVLDYVVVHEMAHLVHLNHSRDFWNLVESILPEYQKQKSWLKKNGSMLNIAERLI